MASGQLALLTDKGLWLAPVGEDDHGETEKVTFKQVTTDGPKAWLSLTAFDKIFVVLQQTAQDGLLLARYTSDGQRKGLPVDLPDTVKAMVRKPGTVYDLAWLGDRIYVVVETPVPGGSVRRAFSVAFEPQADLRREHLLEPLPDYRLLFMDGALYTINRASGQIFRFATTEAGQLDTPGKATSAINEGKSIIAEGLFIAAGSVLAVLSPTSIPSSEEAPWSTKSGITEKVWDIPEDLIYNPQKDCWAACGNGLIVKEGAVAAFRGGISKRLWVLQPDGEMRTIMDASENLFARDYVRKSQFNGKFPSKPLSPFLDAVREFQILNNSELKLGPVDDTCRMAGLDDFSSSGPVAVTPLPVVFARRDDH